MTFQRDGSASTYGSTHSKPPGGLLAAGWLSADHPFDQGPVGDPSEHDLFCDRLFEACRSNVVAKMRGYHDCEFCDQVVRDPTHPSGWRVPDMRVEERNGVKTWVGNGEVRVTEPSGIRWTAPTMIYHYVVVHGYKPPSGFVNGVLRGTFDQPETLR